MRLIPIHVRAERWVPDVQKDNDEKQQVKGSVSSEHKEIVRDDILQYELLEGNGPKGAPKGDPIMQVRDLHVSFATEAGVCRAVRGVNFDLWRGRTLGIVGESGSGKSVTALSLIGLLDDNAKVTGSIIMNGEELIGKTDEEMSEIRGERIAMVFQDPLSALTPMFTIGDQIAEGLITHHPTCPSSRFTTVASSCSIWSASRSPRSVSAASRTSSPVVCVSA